MNKEQVKSAVRWIITFAGGTLVGWAVRTGLVDSDTVWSILNSEAFIGIVASAVTLVLSMFKHTTANAVAAVAAIPDSDLKKAGVVSIITDTTSVGKALAEATEGNVVSTTWSKK